MQMKVDNTRNKQKKKLHVFWRWCCAKESLLLFQIKRTKQVKSKFHCIAYWPSRFVRNYSLWRTAVLEEAQTTYLKGFYLVGGVVIYTSSYVKKSVFSWWKNNLSKNKSVCIRKECFVHDASNCSKLLESAPGITVVYNGYIQFRLHLQQKMNLHWKQSNSIKHIIFTEQSKVMCLYITILHGILEQ